MKLKNAAKYFDLDSVYDAYTNALLFKAQFGTFDSTKPDGNYERRRTISAAPGIVEAPRRAIVVQAEQWLMGNFVTDAWKDQAIRQTASAKKVTDSYTLLSPAQAALHSSSGTETMLAHTKYLKDTVNTLGSSEYTPFFEVMFGITETVPDGWFIRSADHYLHIRSVYTEVEGFIVVEADELGGANSGAGTSGCEVAATFAGPVNPVTELPTANTTTTGVLMDMYQLYEYRTQATPDNQPGDHTLVVAKSAVTPLRNQLVTIAGEPWRIFAFKSYHDAWNVHLRRA